MTKVFISYARKDIDYAKKISNILRKHNINTSVDFLSLGTGDLVSQITENIKSSTSFICVLSDNYLNSQWTRREIEYANSLGKKIFVIVVGDYNWESANWFNSIVQESNFIYFDSFASRAKEIFASDIDKDFSPKPKEDRPPKKSVEPNLSCESATQSFLIGLLSRLISWSWSIPGAVNIRDYEPNTKHKKSGLSKCKWIFIAIILLIISSIVSYLYIDQVDSRTPNCSATPIENSKSNYQEDIDIISSDSCDYTKPFTSIEDNVENSLNNDDEHFAPPYNPTLIYLLLCVGLVIITIAVIVFIRKRKVRIKLHCNCKSNIYVDNDLVAVIQADTVHYIYLKKGEYIFRFCSADDESLSKSIKKEIKSSNTLIDVELKQDILTIQKKLIKCFIAGSTMLQKERDALRAAIAQVHNTWDKGQKFEILSYTYEDFERFVVLGGQQSRYEIFISKEANLAIFIISGKVGKITLTEFDKAVEALNNFGHPQIIIFNDSNSEMSEDGLALQKRANELKQYWIEYGSIKALKDEFIITLQWMLINLY